jgi:hypothetical protein
MRFDSNLFSDPDKNFPTLEHVQREFALIGSHNTFDYCSVIAFHALKCSKEHGMCGLGILDIDPGEGLTKMFTFLNSMIENSLEEIFNYCWNDSTPFTDPTPAWFVVGDNQLQMRLVEYKTEYETCLIYLVNIRGERAVAIRADHLNQLSS